MLVPVKSCGAKDSMAAILAAFKRMGKQPDLLMTDPESVVFNKDIAASFA